MRIAATREGSVLKHGTRRRTRKQFEFYHVLLRSKANYSVNYHHLMEFIIFNREEFMNCYFHV